MHFNIINTA